MTTPIIVTRYKWSKGRAVFEVPVNVDSGNRNPRCPVGGGLFFYTPDFSRCAVVATQTAESYLKQRKYARYLGTADYAPNGIDHFQLDLGGPL